MFEVFEHMAAEIALTHDLSTLRKAAPQEGRGHRRALIAIEKNVVETENKTEGV